MYYILTNLLCNQNNLEKFLLINCPVQLPRNREKIERSR
jgi:hypothetical protein